MTARPKAYSYIRMSTELQLKGDSLRRQLEASKAYAASHQLELVETFDLADIGVSAFKGRNVALGALGQFIKAVESGEVERGSYLLVESFDRMSRQPVQKSLSLFLRLIEAGIIVVTLTDNRVYREGEVELEELIVSVVVMSRAHEESATKSKRIKAAWANKRANASNKPLTATCPAWLKLSADRKRYEIIEERAAIVRRIYEEAANGIGAFASIRRMNQDKVPTFTGIPAWHISYLVKILGYRSVLGEFQPHHRVDGRRVPIGEPIAGYFPAIISQDLFYRAQQGRAERLQHSRGRKGKFLTNLFSGLAKCAYCRAPMKYESKGSGPKGGAYLVCYDALRGMDCFSKGWRYDHFETSFLAFVEELDLESILDEGIETKSVALQNEIASLKGQISVLREDMERTFDLLSRGSAVEFVSKKLAEQEAKRNELEQLVKAKEIEAQSSEIRESEFLEGRAQIKELLGRLKNPEQEDIYKLRARISAHIKTLIDVLFVAPLGQLPLTEKTVQTLSEIEGQEDVAAYIKNTFSSEREKRRYFLIGFKDGTVRAVYPNSQDPLIYLEQIVTAWPLGIQMITDDAAETSSNGE